MHRVMEIPLERLSVVVRAGWCVILLAMASLALTAADLPPLLTGTNTVPAKPAGEESAEAQEKVCLIHVKQMEKPDRDDKHASKAEEECRLLLTQFPNSKFAPQAQQLLRNIQETLAEKEMRVGTFYHNKGSHPAASNRLQALTEGCACGIGNVDARRHAFGKVECVGGIDHDFVVKILFWYILQNIDCHRAIGGVDEQLTRCCCISECGDVDL